jgi:DNA-binding ferritin-like protein
MRPDAAIDEASEAGDADTVDILTAFSRALDKSLGALASDRPDV